MTRTPLARRLGLCGSVSIGLASMIGAGVFAVWAPAAAAAGWLLLGGLGIAAIVAGANAGSSARLAARYPSAGGAYVYGRERLGPWWGFLAGWSFVVGKTASCAAMAMTATAYLVPATEWQRPVAAVAVTLLTAVNLLGVQRTAAAATAIVAIVLAVLAVVVAAGLTTGLPALVGGLDASAAPETTGAHGVLQSAGLLFFAFAGYARIATLGEEVRRPERTIPRAIAIAFGLALVVYTLVAIVTLGVLGVPALAASPAPLADVARAAGIDALAPVVAVAAALASLGALLALLAGVGRTTLAMARDGELPRPLGIVHTRFGTPHRAELAAGAVILALVLTVDLRGAIGFSSFGVLLYYAVANASALTLRGPRPRVARASAVLGAIGCLVLAASLPWPSLVAGAVVIAVGVVGRLLVHRRRRTNVGA